jgi:hypothetical protein
MWISYRRLAIDELKVFFNMAYQMTWSDIINSRRRIYIFVVVQMTACEKRYAGPKLNIRLE